MFGLCDTVNPRYLHWQHVAARKVPAKPRRDSVLNYDASLFSTDHTATGFGVHGRDLEKGNVRVGAAARSPM
jgi:hypothetical protein